MASLFRTTSAATLAAALLITSVAEAQQGQRAQRGQRRPGGFGGPRGSLLFLLSVEELRKEINLDDTQAALVKIVEEESRGDQPEQRFNFREASEEERQKYFAERRVRAEKEAKAAKEMLPTVLSKEQMKRLTEISIQQQGASALNDADVAGKLKITAEQKEKIATTLQANSRELQSKMRELFQGGGFDGNFGDIRTQMTTLRAEADRKVLTILTLDQQKQFETMKGKAFEMPRRGFGRGRGRGRPGGGDRPRRPQRPDSE